MLQIFEYGLLRVEISNDEIYMRNSNHNKNVYDFEYINKANADSLASKYGVKILRDGYLIKSAILIAGGGGVYCTKLQRDMGLSAVANTLEHLHINQSKNFLMSFVT